MVTNGELQAVLEFVRTLAASRDKFCRELAQLKADAARQIDLMIAERDGLEQAILKAPHGLACASWADQACDCWKSDVRLGGTGAKPTVSNLIGATSSVGYAQPCRCDRDDNGTWHGKCTCQKSADEAKRLGWLEAANFLETLGQVFYARDLRREAGVVDGE